MSEDFGPIILSRKLSRVANGSIVSVQFAQPQAKDHDTWVCESRILGLGSEKTASFVGSDSAQALIIAIEGVRRLLASYADQLSWGGGEPGELGFPRYIPMGFGKDYSDSVETFMEQEAQRFGAGNSSSGEDSTD